jgi:hypothetical protein
MSGTTLDAQYRYATGAQEILRRWIAGEKQEPANLIVENGEVSMNNAPKTFLTVWRAEQKVMPLRRIRKR